jgi:hypothetical protein
VLAHGVGASVDGEVVGSLVDALGQLTSLHQKVVEEAGRTETQAIGREPGGAMKVWHLTGAAGQIIAEGFRDSTGSYMTVNEYTGVWVSAEPLTINEGADGDTYLTLEVPEAELLDFEWVEEGKGYREFLVPAATLNKYGPPSVDQTKP